MMKKTKLVIVLILNLLLPSMAEANSGDFNGNVAIGSGYAAIGSAPLNGLIVQGVTGIGTSLPHAGTALDLGNNTNSMLLPVGSTGQRPTGVQGMLRFNSSTPAAEVYNGTAWSSLGGGTSSGWILIGPTQTASNNASISFTGITQTYDRFMLVLTNVLPVTSNAALRLQISENNGSSYISNYYDWAQFDWTAGGYGSNGMTGDSSFPISGGVNNGGIGINGQVYLGALSNNAVLKMISSDVSYINVTPNIQRYMPEGYYTADYNPINAIQIFFSSGNIASGKISLYGLAN